MAEAKMRVHILAKELSVPSKTIIEKCKAEGISSVKNHMSTLSAGLHATIREWFSEGAHETVLETADRVDLKKVRIKKRRKTPAATAISSAAVGKAEAGQGDVESAEPGTDISVAVAVAEAPSEQAVAEAPAEVAALVDVPPAALPEVSAPVAAEMAVDIPADAVVSEEVATEPVAEAPVEKVPPKETEPNKPVGPQNVPVPAKLQGPRVVRYEAPDYDTRPVRRPSPVRARRDEAGGGVTAGPPAPTAPTTADVSKRVDEKTPRKGRLGSRRAVTDKRESAERIAEWRDRDLAERRQRLASATGRRIHRRRSGMGTAEGGRTAPTGPKTQARVHEPVRVKEFCAETGLNFMQFFKQLRDEFGLIPNVNMTLETQTAELLAMQYGIELEVVPARTKLDELQEEFATRERKNLRSRPPVVAMLGHVDHGKTSLLDAIRQTRVVAGEDGGITQHIGSYHLDTALGAVTFLDTPGHEAFTALRARGAQITDVVVLVVAADDGLMPQTIEAINHAKAAGVPVVVALNKIDLGDQNKLKIFGQLTEHGLTPAGEWGGDVDVIETSATKGVGITDLIEHLGALNSILDLKADETVPAMGTVIEAETKVGVGAVARVLVQDGTLRVGDVVVCGNAFGKVRALLDDRGQRIRAAGPSIPVEVWGLDDVPAAGDKLYQAENLQRAKDIATEIKQARLSDSRQQSTKVVSLEDIKRQRDSGGIPELNVILKADVDGSVSALKQSLAQFPSDEVRLAIRHAGVGVVNDGDVLLASTCRGIVVAFRVETSVGSRRLAERHGVEVRSYRVIYDVCDDIKKALEGLLVPEERIERRAIAEVRQVFHVGKTGVVAGSVVSEGTLNRTHLAKVIRDGVVVREGCEFASLRRFKEDVKEVRSGLDCGIHLEGFDDVHVGDVIESYEVIKVARTF